jgi:hypothetical protein
MGSEGSTLDLNVTAFRAFTRVPPEVRVRNNGENGEPVIEWWADDLRGESKKVAIHAVTSTLSEFRKLADAPDERIREFVCEWGVLGVDVTTRQDGRRIWQSEPISLWRRYAREAQALLNIGACLRIGERTRLEDWRTLYAYRGKEQNEYGEAHAQNAWEQKNTRILLTSKILNWFDDVVLRPTLVWGKEEKPGFGLMARVSRVADLPPEFDEANSSPDLTSFRDYSRYSVRAALGMQLMAAITGNTTWFPCSMCGEAYQPKNGRMPRLDRARLCGKPDCRRQQRNKVEAKSKRKSRAEKRLRDEAAQQATL